MLVIPSAFHSYVNFARLHIESLCEQFKQEVIVLVFHERGQMTVWSTFEWCKKTHEN